MFKQPSTNNWKSWITGLATFPAMLIGFSIPGWVTGIEQAKNKHSQKIKDLKYRTLIDELVKKKNMMLIL